MTKFNKIGCLLNLLFFTALTTADDFSDGDLVNQTFWVKPAKEIYRRLEFYREPRIESPSFFTSSKKKIRIISVGRGWIKFNILGAGYEEAYVPLGYFRRNFYNYASFNSYAFDRATFFNEDPDAIKEKAAAATLPSIGKKNKPKSIASKFFRHSHKKCCGVGSMSQPDYAPKTPAR
jgi:hypothetical protein